MRSYYQNQFTPKNGYNPRFGTRTKPNMLNFNADDVWAAACSAQRINMTYLKSIDNTEAVSTNRQIVDMFLADTTLITDEDREQGKLVRKYYQALTFKVLKGIKLSEFDNNAMVIANRDTATDTYGIAVITSLPSCYERGVKRDTVDNRINFASGGFIGKPGDKVTLTIEVLKSFYSQNWAVFYTTGITSDDQVVFFGNKEQMPVGENITVSGTVKAHRDDSTQLNRVKIG